MYYLYAIKPNKPKRLVATFDSEQLLLSYVRWATLSTDADGVKKFEQGSPLVGATGYEYDASLSTNDDAEEALHNPSPSML
jgi:hypothetical protein